MSKSRKKSRRAIKDKADTRKAQAFAAWWASIDQEEREAFVLYLQGIGEHKESYPVDSDLMNKQKLANILTK